MITLWERAGLLALLCVMFPCVFVTFPYGVSGQVWFLIISIPDICLFLYFDWVCCRLHDFIKACISDSLAILLTLYLMEAPVDTFPNRADPDQAAVIRAA